jgi:hypothetical protein
VSAVWASRVRHSRVRGVHELLDVQQVLVEFQHRSLVLVHVTVVRGGENLRI